MKKSLILVLLIILTGCVEQFDLNLEDKEPRIVIDGLITNKPGPYYVRVTKSKTGEYVPPDYEWRDNLEAVKNAIVIISSSRGEVDTLIPAPEYMYEYDPIKGYFRIIYDAHGQIIDTLFPENPFEFTHERGFYKTNHIAGVIGVTYHLEVIVGNHHYNASGKLYPVPEIDSVIFEKRALSKDGQEYYVPFLYYDEPDTINYYLVQLQTNEYIRSYVESTWQLSVLSDDYLEPYVNGLEIEVGQTPDGKDQFHYTGGEEFYLALSSIDENAYHYYKALVEQFDNDGGVFKPVPASPPTNISDGGLGYFRASAVEEVVLIVE